MMLFQKILLACLLLVIVPSGAQDQAPGKDEKAEEKKEEGDKPAEKKEDAKPSMAERSAAIGKVVEMLKEMKEQLVEDTEGDKKMYDNFVTLTQAEIKKAKATILEATDKAKKLKATMESAAALQTAKNQELARAADAMIKVQAKLKMAEEQRANEQSTNLGNLAQLSEGSEQLGLAIEKVEGMFAKKEAALIEASVEAFDPTPTPAGTGLLQATKSLRTALNAGAGDLLDSSQQRLLTRLFSVAGEQRRSLRAKPQESDSDSEVPSFVQLDSESESEELDDLDLAEDSQSQESAEPAELGGMLKDVKKETDSEKDKAAESEAKSAAAYAELAKKLKADVEAKEAAVKELKAIVSSSQEEASKAKNEILLAERTLKVTSAQMSQLNISLTDKKNDYEKKAASRIKEKDAVDEAIKVLSPALLQIAAAPAPKSAEVNYAGSFLQMSSEHHFEASVNRHGAVLSFLQEDLAGSEGLQAESMLASPGLASLLLQSHSSLGKGDILQKVKDMIREMLAKLKKTQAQDMQKAEWCNREMEHSKKTKDDKQSRADKVESKKSALDAELASLSATTGGGKKKLADMKDQLLKATELRQTEKEKAAADLVMYEEDRTVIEKALVVLHRVYGTSGSGSDGPSGESGHAVSGKGAGVVGLLEMQRDNFLRMEEETQKGEKDSAADFEDMKSSAQLTIMNFEKDLAYALSKETKLKEEVTRANADLASYNKEIQAVNEYIAQLEQQCSVAGDSYQERMQKRNQQLSSLKEALKELSK
mmetsp:Transcript_75643/g.133494  ORF Transcript_75643/g.133494 Transcript_75643/m.133494 type:complete len:766 (+) Transcript_75643:109-2406(+)